jgi:type III restriction enzyme
MSTDPLSNPILNSPFAEPTKHYELGSRGPTGEVLEGRRPSESFVPVPKTRKGRSQQALDFDVVGDRRDENSLINDIRRALELWRTNNWNGVTPYTRKLLSHWAAGPPTRDDSVSARPPKRRSSSRRPPAGTERRTTVAVLSR